ncbi:MAG: phosphatidylserine/phosphatidylglycerophosphate/cardiolipin synthase family protein [Flavobacteriales bacterium]|nr:phosphatidylserine/phosphatidylglycerophosphate/cardiolipin synthase family protein [Flavobacteriales bacterium]
MADRGAYGVHNRVQWITGGAAYFDRLTARIDQAEQVVHLQVYIFAADTTGDRVGDALVRAARRGVAVHVLLDAFGSDAVNKDLVDDLRAAGGHLYYFQPIWRTPRFRFGRRLHHKVCTIDHRLAFVTGRNVADRYNDLPGAPAWRDMAVEIEGEAAWELARVCARIWNRGVVRGLASRCVLPGPDSRVRAIASLGEASHCPVRVRRNDRIRGRSEIIASYRSLFRDARSEVGLMGSYFLPGRGVQAWMRLAVDRGVAVHVVLAGTSDVWLSKHAERYLYRRLLKDGVRLYEYLPTVLHAKTAVRDGRWCTVGSFNVNRLSAYASIELNVDIDDPTVGHALSAELHDVIAHQCRKVTLDEVTHERPWVHAAQWLAYLVARALLALMTVRYRRGRA